MTICTFFVFPELSRVEHLTVFEKLVFAITSRLQRVLMEHFTCKDEELLKI